MRYTLEVCERRQNASRIEVYQVVKCCCGDEGGMKVNHFIL